MLARQAGRFGQDLRIDVTGTDLDGDCVAVRLRAFVKSGDAIKVSDTEVDANGAAELPWRRCSLPSRTRPRTWC